MTPDRRMPGSDRRTMAACPIREMPDGRLACHVAEDMLEEAGKKALQKFMAVYFEVDVTNIEELRRFRGGMRWAEDMYIMVNASKRRALTVLLLVVAAAFFTGVSTGWAFWTKAKEWILP